MAFLLPFLAAVALAAPSKRAAPVFKIQGDVPFSVSSETIAAAITCPNGFPSSSSPPVLLVHGTAANGEDTWKNTYVPALKRDGYTACWVDLPNRASVDAQISAEYVAYALHYMYQVSGNVKTHVVTHSQGGLNAQWAFQFWPSTWKVTASFLPLSPDFLGITMAKPLFDAICPGFQCEPSIWQQLAGSKMETALRAHPNFKANVPTNAIWTANDEIITPPRDNALLSGGTTIGIQEVCPGRFIDHIYIVQDAVAYALQKDAMKNGGKADPKRILRADPLICFRKYAPGMDPNLLTQFAFVFNGFTQGFLFGVPRVTSEPPLMPYVTAK